ncbi:phosphatidylserine/phosphatidylglycerophosphate/cardiolipin synthase family protein [Kutzneria kofuensis]|uniref:phospholipase D n=1 Tax=Kutzneria kofuensis TaxID=103725 RepID=A0A7W9NKH7_9PSEU|nr:phosphatidylserine/phosphatidylglycerophosphate/cardiolipin synthase family protein [Kutzneria kofuensis]MBB5895401.1 phosphatidylserine/phosphatidylglycerophosphate/cardiolipin synthase-like enzyme [Kutzneria kofuensis]
MTNTEITLLRDTGHGGQAAQPSRIAAQLATFIAGARTSVHIAIYDFRLGDALAKPVVSALRDAAAGGVDVRIAYDASKPATGFAALGADPAPPGTAQWLHSHFAGSQVALRPVTTPSGKLMHNKYVVLDGRRVWTGSANFTDDAWTRQENNVLRFTSTVLASAYEQDFEQLWQSGDIRRTGIGDRGVTTIDDETVAWSFAPGEGPAMDADLVGLVTGVRHRLVIASMVITSHALLSALATAVGAGVHLTGMYDAGQMGPIAHEWAQSKSAASAQALADWKTVSAKLVGKKSTPYSPTAVHDFMHLKVLVSDDTVATGSYNFSANAEGNAENQLRITAAKIADSYAAYIHQLVDAYTPKLASHA